MKPLRWWLISHSILLTLPNIMTEYEEEMPMLVQPWPCHPEEGPCVTQLALVDAGRLDRDGERGICEVVGRSGPSATIDLTGIPDAGVDVARLRRERGSSGFVHSAHQRPVQVPAASDRRGTA